MIKKFSFLYVVIALLFGGGIASADTSKVIDQIAASLANSTEVNRCKKAEYPEHCAHELLAVMAYDFSKSLRLNPKAVATFYSANADTIVARIVEVIKAKGCDNSKACSPAETAARLSYWADSAIFWVKTLVLLESTKGNKAFNRIMRMDITVAKARVKLNKILHMELSDDDVRGLSLAMVGKEFYGPYSNKLYLLFIDLASDFSKRARKVAASS
jgi:hypothetical protein